MLSAGVRAGIRATATYRCAITALQSSRSFARLPLVFSLQRHVSTSSIRGLRVANVLRADTEADKTSAGQPDEAALQKQISSLINSDKVVLFMKGTPEEPRCGFSRGAVMILQAHEVPFSAVNILEDDGLREAVKRYSGWPTYPQCYVQGKLVGGTDILLEMHRSGEIVDELKKAGIDSKFNYKENPPKNSSNKN